MKKSTPRPQIDCLGLGIMPLDLLFEVVEYPQAGSKIDGTGLTTQGGGPVPNVLVGLSRLGKKTSLISAIANDLPGELGRRELIQDGVDTTFLVVKKGSSDTACGLIERETGRRTMVLNRVIGVRPRDVATSRLPIPRTIHLDGRDLDACIKLARWGCKVGATVCFDIGSMRNDVSAIFGLIDHLVVADNYAFGFTGQRSARKAIVRLQRLCPGTVVVTEGTKGSVGCEHGHYVRVPAFKVRNVDTTGAGDAFHTGYIYGLLQGFDLVTRMRFGAAMAALKCTRPGARAGIPGLRRINSFLGGGPEKYA